MNIGLLYSKQMTKIELIGSFMTSIKMKFLKDTYILQGKKLKNLVKNSMKDLKDMMVTIMSHMA